MQTIVIGLILVLQSLQLVQAAPLDCVLYNAKVNMVRKIKLTGDASFDDIKNAYDQLNKIHKNRSLKVDAKRLINEEDWNKALQKGKATPWFTYGETTIEDWNRAKKYVESLDPSNPATVSLLKSIHIKSTQNLPFHGFEGRRLKMQYERGLISEEAFKKGLQQAYKDNKEIHQVPHHDLRGVFRSSQYDNITHAGSSLDDKGVRYFSLSEKDAMINNPYIDAIESTFIKTGPDQYRGKVHYISPERVSRAVDDILKTTELELKRSKNIAEKVSIIQLMKKNLMSVHPFLDGNGRTIRLLEDYLLRRYGLPPSLFPNEADLTMNVTEATEYTRLQMINYVNEHADDYLSVTP